MLEGRVAFVAGFRGSLVCVPDSLEQALVCINPRLEYMHHKSVAPFQFAIVHSESLCFEYKAHRRHNEAGTQPKRS